MVSAFSIDLKDLYCLLPHVFICQAVEEGIVCVGAIPFKIECGISLGGFIELLSFCLHFTFIKL